MMRFLTFPTTIILRLQMQTKSLISTIIGTGKTPYNMNKFTNSRYIYFSNIQENFCKPSNSLVKMEIATSCGSFWLSLGSLWTYSFDFPVYMMNNVDIGNYSLSITTKQYEQLLRVYKACISPSQFMPLLITDTNRCKHKYFTYI